MGPYLHFTVRLTYAVKMQALTDDLLFGSPGHFSIEPDTAEKQFPNLSKQFLRISMNHAARRLSPMTTTRTTTTIMKEAMILWKR